VTRRDTEGGNSNRSHKSGLWGSFAVLLPHRLLSADASRPPHNRRAPALAPAALTGVRSHQDARPLNQIQTFALAGSLVGTSGQTSGLAGK
jgi:hypothetical protein